MFALERVRRNCPNVPHISLSVWFGVLAGSKFTRFLCVPVMALAFGQHENRFVGVDLLHFLASGWARELR